MDPGVAKRMTEHVLAIAAEHGVTLRWISRWRSAAAVDGVAYVPEVKHPHDYLFCLHEIGHCAAPDALRLEDDFDSYSEVLNEGAAWAWAVAVAKPSLARHLRARDWDTVAYAYRTYLAYHARIHDPGSSHEGVPGSVRHSERSTTSPEHEEPSPPCP